MANIHIPLRFNAKLKEGDQLFHGIVIKTIAEFGEILEDNKLYFFEEYTDHGIKHIENVIASSDHLVTDNTFEAMLTARDIGSYILAVVLHDIAMHISFDGFVRIIEGDYDDVRIAEFDKHSWKELWQEYLSEAKKFNARQLKAIFGEEVVIHVPDLSNKGAVTNHDKKLIGEFLRRHHPRLAHEIALKGFPGGKGCLEFANGLEQRHKDLIGLIARSHGQSLRRTIDYLEYDYGRKNKRHPLGIHAVYLMVLLRISDYIQIDHNRTSKTLVKLKTFASPFSEAEHHAHLCINNVDTKYQDDPERIYVSAFPTDSKAFLKLKKLVEDIQYELDISWAVLGEHYGMIERPEIRFRRITSNLDEETFRERQSYIADNFSFTASDEIIRLLIAPLYGNNSSFGVRELLQNAVDACKEREEIERSNGNDHYQPLVRLEVVKEGEDHYFMIVDNGVGMTPDIIKNYFLRAGASFRKSAEWQKAFVDDNGNTIVRRNGRFGVGLLAAFLIGKRIEVATRKVGEAYGYKFSTGLDAAQINITKDRSVEPGTVIKIRIDKDKVVEFEPYDVEDRDTEESPEWYGWYTLSYPRIEYRHLGKPVTGYLKTDPDLHDDLPLEWMALEANGFNKIHWTYSRDFSGISLSCNGIVIPGDEGAHKLLPDINVVPMVSVFDYEGNLPITLDRSRLSGEYPFLRSLVEDIYKDFLACALMFKKPSRVLQKSIQVIDTAFGYPGLKKDKSHHALTPDIDDLLISKKGYMLNADYCIKKHGAVPVVFIQSEQFESPGYTLDFDVQDAFVQLSKGEINSILQYSVVLTKDSNSNYERDDEAGWSWAREDEEETEEEDIAFATGDAQGRIYMRKEKYQFLFKTDKKRIDNRVRKKHQFQFEAGEWVCLHLGDPLYTNGLVTPEFLEREQKTIAFLKEFQLEQATNIRILNELLQRYLGDDVIIPYELEERKQKYPLAFKELERYMRKYI